MYHYNYKPILRKKQEGVWIIVSAGLTGEGRQNPQILTVGAAYMPPVSSRRLLKKRIVRNSLEFRTRAGYIPPLLISNPLRTIDTNSVGPHSQCGRVGCDKLGSPKGGAVTSPQTGVAIPFDNGVGAVYMPPVSNRRLLKKTNCAKFSGISHTGGIDPALQIKSESLRNFGQSLSQLR